MTFFHPNHSIMQTETMDNIIDRDKLQADYINRVLDDMDIKDMMAILYDYMDVEFDKYTVDEMIEQVEEYYPDLMEESKEN
jgi:hypothetical protein